MSKKLRLSNFQMKGGRYLSRIERYIGTTERIRDYRLPTVSRIYFDITNYPKKSEIWNYPKSSQKEIYRNYPKSSR